MTRRTFNKILNGCRARKAARPAGALLVTRLDLTKIDALPAEVKRQMVEFLVRERGPILGSLLWSGTTPTVDRGWLESCGYFYATKGPETGLVFVHTGAHEIR